MTTLTVRLSEKEARDLMAVCKLTGKSRSKWCAAPRARLFSSRLNAVRALAVPRAREAGLLTDDGVFSGLT